MVIFFSILCAIWVASLLLVSWGIRSLKYLRNVTPVPTSSKVSVVIAARDEAETIEHALQFILAQKYSDFEVIVVNDRSSDATGNILRRMQSQHPQLQVIDVDALPARWLGKNHAMHQAASSASGAYILFTDADVVMAPATIARAVTFVESNKLDHIAVFPEIPAPDFWTGVSFALFGLGFLMLTQPWFVRNGRTPMPVGIGAFNFIRASKYRDIGGHSSIPLRPDDDVALAYRLKHAGARQDILIGKDLISVAWYPSVTAFIRGLEKNAFAPFGYSFLKFAAAMGTHVLTYVVPWIGLLLGPTIAPIALATIIAQMLTLGATQAVAHKTWRYAPAFLPGALIFEVAVTRAVYLTLRQRGIRWRDTFYPLDVLRTNHLG